MKGTGLNNFPQFGVMEGVKILVCGGAIAGPAVHGCRYEDAGGP